jgi:hypothetical protein
MFAGSAAIDTLTQHLIGRWLQRSAGVDPAKGLLRLGALCSLRMVVYLAPTTAMALGG